MKAQTSILVSQAADRSGQDCSGGGGGAFCALALDLSPVQVRRFQPALRGVLVEACGLALAQAGDVRIQAEPCARVASSRRGPQSQARRPVNCHQVG